MVLKGYLNGKNIIFGGSDQKSLFYAIQTQLDVGFTLKILSAIRFKKEPP